VKQKLTGNFEEEGTKDSKLPPARKISPRKTGVVEKLAGVFEKEGTAGIMTWLIHQFIITDSGKVLGITI
jgi:hypothetical protein